MPGDGEGEIRDDAMRAAPMDEELRTRIPLCVRCNRQAGQRRVPVALDRAKRVRLEMERDFRPAVGEDIHLQLAVQLQSVLLDGARVSGRSQDSGDGWLRRCFLAGGGIAQKEFILLAGEQHRLRVLCEDGFEGLRRDPQFTAVRGRGGRAGGPRSGCGER